jgi:hypothetical protein
VVLATDLAHEVFPALREPGPLVAAPRVPDVLERGFVELALRFPEVLLDALDEVAAVDEVLLAEGEEVAAVGAPGGGAMVNASRGKRSRWATRPRVWIEAKRTSASSSRSSPL